MLNNINANALSVSDIRTVTPHFDELNTINKTISDKNIEILNEKLNKVNDNNGCFSNIWNNIKNSSGKGIGDKNCDEAIEAYKRGEIDFEEADKRIKEYSTKQNESLNLFSNITSSVAALGITALAAGAVAAAGGFAAPVILAAIGAATGAITKAGFKLFDRATNNIEGDALNSNQIIKDGLSGAVAGSVATITMGTASSAPTIISAVKSCGITGIKTGAVSCSANYIIDCAFEDNKKFKTGEFALNTLEGAIVGGTVGAVMGGANATMHATGILNSGCNFKTFTSNAGQTSSKDVAANSICTAEYKVLNDRIRSIYT